MRAYIDILKLSWPLALGMINNAVMQFIDRAYLAGHSMAAFEAVLPASTLAWVFTGFFQAIVAYSGVFVAQYHGAKNPAMCATSFRAASLIALASGAIVAALVPAAIWILSATAPSAELLALEREYCGICLFGGFFVCAQMAAAAYFTGRGRTRIVFWANLLANVINIVLDPFLIFGWCGLPRLGIAGAAYATVFSMAVQWLWLTACAVRDIRREGGGEATESAARLVLRVLRFGVPSGAYNVLSMLSFTAFVFVTEKVGDLEFAVSNAVFTVNYLLYAPMEGFALAAQTLVGQARGRGDNAAAAADARRTVLLAVAVAAAFALAALLLCRPVLSVFAPPDQAQAGEFLSLGLKLFLLMGCYLVLDAVDTVLCGALRGAGDTKFVMAWMTFCAFGVWMPLVWIVSKTSFTMPLLWTTTVAYVAVLFVGSFIRWRRGRWKAIKLTPSSSS